MVDQSYYKKADEIIRSHYERCAASLIPIMQDIQAEYRYLPAELADLRSRSRSALQKRKALQCCNLLRELFF